MLGFQLHYHDFGLQHIIYGVGHLRGETLLHLRPGSGNLKGAAQLAHAGNPLSGNITDPGFPEEGEKVVLAHGMKGQISQGYRIAGFGLENRVYGVFGANPHTREEGLIHPGHAGRCLLQSFPAGILADCLKDVGHRLLYPALLDRGFPSLLTLSQGEKELAGHPLPERVISFISFSYGGRIY